MGPSIGPCCYQVGNEVAEQIGANWKEEMRGAWIPEGAKGRLDLRAVNEAQLVAIGVPRRQIQQLGLCTACNVEKFFSYRKEGKTGSQLSFIGLLSLLRGAFSVGRPRVVFPFCPGVREG